MERFFECSDRAGLDGCFGEARAPLDPGVVIAPPGGGCAPRRGDDAFAKSLERRRGGPPPRTRCLKVERLATELCAARSSHELDSAVSGERRRERGLELWLLRRGAKRLARLLRELHPPAAAA